MNCEIDIHFDVTVSSNSFVYEKPNILYKNAENGITDNKVIWSKSNKNKKKHKRRYSDPGPKRQRDDSI